MKKLLGYSPRGSAILINASIQERLAYLIFSRLRIRNPRNINCIPADGDEVSLAHHLPVALLIGIVRRADTPVAIRGSPIPFVQSKCQSIHRDTQQIGERAKSPGIAITPFLLAGN